MAEDQVPPFVLRIGLKVDAGPFRHKRLIFPDPSCAMTIPAKITAKAISVTGVKASPNKTTPRRTATDVAR